MVERKRIGIAYSYDENWVGGTYYVQNLISALNTLPATEQPNLFVLTSDKKAFINLEVVTKYAKLFFLNELLSPIETLLNKITFKLFNKKFFIKKVKLDFLFPLSYVPQNYKNVANIIFWIPDLQEKYLPHFFSSDEINLRNSRYQKMVSQNKPIVFSSYTAKKDFEMAFPNSLNKKKVIQFAVTHPEIDYSTIATVKEKYNIKGDYFITPNQFWQHKNHIALIEAAKILKDSGTKVQIVFTGKEYDYRSPNYTHDLKKRVQEYNLEDEISFLGFIDRQDQLVLMKFAKAVVQPSLFEGWSTVIEDAKALNQTIIASEIEVHKEQLNDKGYFFSPDNYLQLATILKTVLDDDNCIKYDIDYRDNVLKFAAKIKSLIIENS